MLNRPARVMLAFLDRQGRLRGTLSLAGHTGANTIRFSGRISRSRLPKPGPSTVMLSAVNTAGERSNAVLLRFTIVRT